MKRLLVPFPFFILMASLAVAQTVTVWGSGADIGGKVDALHYAYKELPGDGDVVAHITSIQNTNALAKAGVMIRENLTDTSKNVMMLLTPSSVAMFQRRKYTGNGTITNKVYGIAVPYWVKLSRRGNTFYGYISSDGVLWTAVGSVKIYMGSAYAGFAVSSHDNSVLCEARFEQWSITP